MIVKAVLVFLVAMLILGMFGRWKRRAPPAPPSNRVEPARKCPDCGAYALRAAPDPCARPDCPLR